VQSNYFLFELTNISFKKRSFLHTSRGFVQLFALFMGFERKKIASRRRTRKTAEEQVFRANICVFGGFPLFLQHFNSAPRLAVQGIGTAVTKHLHL
jgi:hypothetical protein